MAEPALVTFPVTLSLSLSLEWSWLHLSLHTFAVLEPSHDDLERQPVGFGEGSSLSCFSILICITVMALHSS